MQASAEHTINTPEQLDALFGEIAEASRKNTIWNYQNDKEQRSIKII